MIRLLLVLTLAILPLRGAAQSVDLNIQEVTSPGGITAWLVEEPAIPFVALELRFMGGTSTDAPGKRGAVNLMTGLIEEGAGEMNAQDFAAARENLAASFSFDVYDDALSISAQFLTENRAEALELLRLALVEPRFDQDAIDRVRGQVLSIIRSDLRDPDHIAGVTFNGLAFGNHPYGTDSNGTEESITALTREDIIAAHQGSLALDRIYIGVVGDITAEELGPILDDLLGGLPQTGAPMPEPVDFGLDGGITVVDYPTPQSTALFGHAGIDQDDDDFFAAYILNVILGGGNFDNRLMDEVREKRGLTYGVGTYLVPKDLSALYLGSIRSQNDRIAEAIEVIAAEWQRMAETGVTPEELETAKRYLTGAYPLRFDGNGPIASILVGMQMQDLPIDYIATRNDRVNAVTLDEINRVAAELLDPEALHFVVVGQPEGLESTE